MQGCDKVGQGCCEVGSELSYGRLTAGRFRVAAG